MHSRYRICVCHADPNNSNMGVTALFASILSGVNRRLDIDCTAFDYLLGDRRMEARVDGGDPIPVRLIGMRSGRRYSRPENLRRMLFDARLGRIGRAINPGVRAIAESDAFLDVSGGDSFTDMYPDRRILLMSRSKLVATALGTPLILLPQTYGPFDESTGLASGICRSARACWARDERSFEALKKLLGSEFDPDRHKCGVDMAFLLEPVKPSESKMEALPFKPSQGSFVGINVSGLIFNDPEAARSKYGFQASYSEVMTQFVTWMLENTDHKILLLPHVMAPVEAMESDLKACRTLRDVIGDAGESRVGISPTSLDQNEVKWAVSKCDWFCGTRMHATIAGLSTCTPTSTVSYSDKALGVFETCGQGREVFDPRKMDTETVIAAMIESYKRRSEIRESLEANIPGVKAIAEKQMDDICEVIRECGDERRSRRSA